MDPTTVFCPNENCPARGHIGKGNIGIHSRKEQRFICHACDKTFSATKGTVFYRLRTSAETVVLIVTLLAHGCPVQAIVAAFGFDERTVADWWARSGRQSQVVHEYLVEQPRDLGQVQADELRVKKQGGIVRVIQFSNSIPMRANACAGWAANRRQAAAIFVWPAHLSSPIVVLRSAAMPWGILPQRTCDRSSSNVTSRTQCDLFSMLQCPRTKSSTRPGVARSEVRLVTP